MVRTGWVEQRPEPARLWVRWRPRGWPRPPWPWTDVASAELGEVADEPAERSASAVEALSAAVDDGVWLPPVAEPASAARRALAARLAEAGVPVVLQLPVTGVAGSEAREPLVPTQPSDEDIAVSAADSPIRLADLASSGVTVLLDPLPALLAGGPAAAVGDTVRFARAIPGAAVVWPLIPGFELDERAARAAARELAAAGVRALQPMALRLTAAQRRRLAEGRGGEVFDALFHGPPADERPFARGVAAGGLAPFLPRPLPRPPLAGAETRRIAGLLALAGELWMRCGRPPAAGQALFRAARWADDAGYDLGALAREGNLGVVAALDERSRALIAEAAAGGTPELVRELLDEYAAPEDAGAGADGEDAVATVSEEVGNG